jgi:hypothetical protein
MMTYFEAVGIKQDFVVAMRFADACGQTREEAFEETAQKYTAEELAEALLVLNEKLEEEQNTNKTLFRLAVKSKEVSHESD